MKDAEGRSVVAAIQQLQAEVRRELEEAGVAVPSESVPALSPETLAGLQERAAELASKSTLREFQFVSGAPLLGSLIAWFRSAWNAVSTKWYVRHLSQQQEEFNRSVARWAQEMAHDVAQEVRWLVEGLAQQDRASVQLTQRLGGLEMQLKGLRDAVQGLQAEVKRFEQAALEARLGRLERSLRRQARALPTVAVPEERAVAQVVGMEMDYFHFEHRFRGSPEAVKEHQAMYLPYFAGKSNVLDIGCGRGEFLELLRQAGVSAQGVDSDQDMVEFCREQGLEVAQEDALEYLRAQSDGTLGGVFLSHVLEHLEPQRMLRLLGLCAEKLQPGGAFVAETNNPACLLAMATHFVLDLSHVKPIHPETLRFLMESLGFETVEVKYTSPVPDEVRLQLLDGMEADPQRQTWLATLNRNLEKLNDFLYGFQDYAVVARKAT